MQKTLSFHEECKNCKKKKRKEDCLVDSLTSNSWIKHKYEMLITDICLTYFSKNDWFLPEQSQDANGNTLFAHNVIVTYADDVLLDNLIREFDISWKLYICGYFHTKFDTKGETLKIALVYACLELMCKFKIKVCIKVY